MNTRYTTKQFAEDLKKLYLVDEVSGEIFPILSTEVSRKQRSSVDCQLVGPDRTSPQITLSTPRNGEMSTASVDVNGLGFFHLLTLCLATGERLYRLDSKLVPSSVSAFASRLVA